MQLSLRVKTEADLPLSYCVYRTRENEREGRGKGEAQTPRRGSQWGKKKSKPQEHVKA